MIRVHLVGHSRAVALTTKMSQSMFCMITVKLVLAARATWLIAHNLPPQSSSMF